MLTKALPAIFGMFIFFYILSSILMGLFFDTVGDPPEEVQQVEPVSTEFSPLDPAVFNDESLNPTELIEIRESDGGSVFSIGGSEEDSNEPEGG